MNISVNGVTEVQDALRTLGTNTRNKAVGLWVNWIGLEAQGEMRQQLPNRFTMRGTKEGFDKAIVFTAARTSGASRRTAELHVGGPGFGGSRTQKLGVILARHEEENARTSSSQLFRITGGKTATGFFVPANGIRTATANPPKQLYPRNIGVSARRAVDGSLLYAKGTKKGSKQKGTGVSYFATAQGIFRRKHSAFGRADVEAIWWFVGRVRTPARLGLWRTASEVVDRRARDLGMQAIEEAVFRATL